MSLEGTKWRMDYESETEGNQVGLEKYADVGSLSQDCRERRGHCGICG